MEIVPVDVTVLRREQLFEHVTAEFARAGAAELPISVAVVDIDHFGMITDTCEPGDGDAIRRQVGERLRGALRKSDAVGHYAGEEFLIVLDPASRGQVTGVNAALVLDRVRKAVASRPFDTARGPLSVTVSIGVVTAVPPCDDPCAAVMAAIDALYQAKADGRNCVRAVSFPGSAVEPDYTSP